MSLNLCDFTLQIRPLATIESQFAIQARGVISAEHFHRHCNFFKSKEDPHACGILLAN